MPRVKLDYVVSFSSEDSENPASNLLAYDVSKKKWLCTTGEPSCSVVLQLTKAVQISTVHIGAYHAALVEVLVGRSETPNDQFEVLVPSSVFLSPMDSRRGSTVERVRSFSAEQLAPARDQRWDRVRVVCSQPYNKHCKYGLSFIHIFEPDTEPVREPAPLKPATSVPPRITLASNYSSDEDDFKPGELFARHQQRTSDVGTKNTEAQIRQATSQALKNITDSSTKLVKTPLSKNNSPRAGPSDFNTDRQRDTLIYNDDDDKPHSKIDSIVQRHKDEKEETKKKEAVQNLFKKDRNTSKLESASKNFKEFLDDTNDFNSRSKESSNDKRSDNDRNNDNQNNSRSKDSNDNDKRNRDNLNNSRSDFRGDERRNKDYKDKTPQRTKVDNKPNGDRDNRKRQHSDDRDKAKNILLAGPVSSAPHTLLAGVVFALSGYENPRRGRLRDQAIAMGARFERDWNLSCTHLICAFPNTPKLRTVRSTQGNTCIAVLGDWIEQCCEKRRLLPWQWFATEPKNKVAPPPDWEKDGGNLNEEKNASECDTDDEIEKVLRKQKKQRTDKSPQPHTSREKSPQRHSSREWSPKPHSSRDTSPKPHSSRDRSPKPYSSRDRSPLSQTSREKSPKQRRSKERSPKPHSSKDRSPKPHSSRDRSPKPNSSRYRSPKAHSSRDRSPISQTSRDLSPKHSKNSHNYSNMSTDSDVAFVKDERIQANITIDSGDSTDEDKPGVKEKVDKSKVLPDFFDGCTFVIEEGVEKVGFDRELLERYVKAYGGVVMDASQLEPDDEVNYVLSAGAESDLKGQRVRADWVWRCHQDKMLCDVGEYAF